MPKTGRPKKEFDIKAFEDLVGLGCTQEEICWYFRDDSGKPANIDTLTRWCKRTFDMTFQEYFKKNGFMYSKIRLRRNQMNLSEKSAAMAIFLGKVILGQQERSEIVISEEGGDTTVKELQEFFKRKRGEMKDGES